MSSTFTMLRPVRAVRMISEVPEQVHIELHQKELEAAREKAYAAGQRDAEERYAKGLKEIKDFQAQTLIRLGDCEKSLFSEAEQALPELILEGVRHIIDTWEPKGDEIEKLVQDVLSSLEGDSGAVKVFLNPSDKAQMLSLHEDMKRDFPDITIVEDPQLRSGECYARGRFGITDGRFSAKLESMRKVFL